MKSRLILTLLLFMLWGLLVIYHNYIPTYSGLIIILGFISIYSFFMHAASRHHRRKIEKNIPEFDGSYEPFVSILVPSHNEEYVIGKTIENIMGLDYDKFELIVIDDRSDDKTAEVIKSYEEKYDNLKAYIRDKQAFPGKSAVLNEAFEMTKGDVICVFDADAKIEPDFLKKILPNLAKKDVGAVQARKMISNKDENILTRCQHNEYTLDVHFQVGRDYVKGAVELRGNGQLVKREALKDIGGWNNKTITDDLDMSTRLHLKGWDVRFCHYARVFEEGVLEFLPLLRQRRRWVEGSIRRYLDYFVEVLFSEDISLRVGIDMWAYISQFVLPVWLVSEFVIQGFKCVRGAENCIFSSAIMLVAICLFFISGLLYSLARFNKLSMFETLKQSVETGLYMVIIWTPIVTFIVFKIILKKRDMDWGKTAHGTPAEAS